jgi:uncharacterized protein (TIGR03435 family)
VKSEEQVCKPVRRRAVFLALAVLVAGLIPIVSVAQAPAATPAPANADPMRIDDTWQGTLHNPQANRDLRIVVKVSKTDTGALKVLNYSIDQGGRAMTATSATFQDSIFKFAIQAIDGSYEGKMSSDGKSIAGQWTQGPSPLPLLLERTTPETAWTIPTPPPRLPPMAADADPSFEVATIKPSEPDKPGKMFRVQGSHFSTLNTTLMDLLTFTYGVQQKQIINAPDWVDKDKWDISAQPDVPGAPNDRQMKTMMRKLLADRFQLKLTDDKKELSAYVLTVSKSGQKMTKSDSIENLPGLLFRSISPVRLTVQNATMTDFCGLLQSAVLDRPVVDQTGLAGKWNFLLTWTADDSQFSGMGMRPPPATDTAADAPPPLFTAIQEQIGLKLDAGKANVPVLMITAVEKPSAN